MNRQFITVQIVKKQKTKIIMTIMRTHKLLELFLLRQTSQATIFMFSL